LTPVVHPDLIVGTETGDDAAVWRIDAGRALVVTADFITPIVDDARTWGKIAATNSISDVYAMGGKPLFALNLVSWNSAELPADLLGEVLAGAAEVGAECGFVTIGGHTVEDPEPKFGLVVVGEARPGHLMTNAALRDGDALVLTKRLGTGIVATAIKRAAAPEPVAAAAIASMITNNAQAPPGRPAAPTSPASACSATSGGWHRRPASTSTSTCPRSRCCPAWQTWRPTAWCPAAPNAISNGCETAWTPSTFPTSCC
jgi:selenide,water dikinase